MEYSKHARIRMAERHITEAEIERIVAKPVRGVYAPPARDRIEHFGYADDGRALNVVTNHAETDVISVVVE